MCVCARARAERTNEFSLSLSHRSSERANERTSSRIGPEMRPPFSISDHRLLRQILLSLPPSIAHSLRATPAGVSRSLTPGHAVRFAHCSAAQSAGRPPSNLSGEYRTRTAAAAHSMDKDQNWTKAIGPERAQHARETFLITSRAPISTSASQTSRWTRSAKHHRRPGS